MLGTPAWRLATRCVRLAYLSPHLATRLLGLVSLANAEAGLRITVAVWHGVPGTVALASAFAIHLAFALRMLATRRHRSLPVVEWIRLSAGLSLPRLRVGHVDSTRGATGLSGSLVLAIGGRP